jgi:hypothetical protein
MIIAIVTNGERISHRREADDRLESGIQRRTPCGSHEARDLAPVNGAGPNFDAWRVASDDAE